MQETEMQLGFLFTVGSFLSLISCLIILYIFSSFYQYFIGKLSALLNNFKFYDINGKGLGV